MMQDNPNVNPGELTFLVTDDIHSQREQVIRMWGRYSQEHHLGGRVAMIATKIANMLDKLQRKERWEAGLTVLALEYVALGCAEQIYGAALALQIEEDGGKRVDSAQSGGGGGSKGKGGQAARSGRAVKRGVAADGGVSSDRDDRPGETD